VHFTKSVSIAAVAAAAAVGLTAGVAGAATGTGADRERTSAVTRINNVNSVPGVSGNWASSQVLRFATVSGGGAAPLADCGIATGSCYSFTASVRDYGAFEATSGALTPNQVVPGKLIRSSVGGSVRGSASFATFFATSLPHARLVPAKFTNGFYTSTWPEMFFAAGTKFTGLTASAWSFTYSAWTVCGYQRWTDSSANGFGDRAGDGNITGCGNVKWWW
jgi:hypothetical protein